MGLFEIYQMKQGFAKQRAAFFIKRASLFNGDLLSHKLRDLQVKRVEKQSNSTEL